MVKGLTAAVMALGLLLGGAGAADAQAQTPCGGLLQPKCPPPAPEPPPPPPPAPTPITAEQYAALDPMLKAAAAREGDDAGKAEDQAFAAACDALTTEDPLIAGNRRVCLADIAGTVTGAALDTCETRQGCRTAISRFTTAIKRYARALRTLTRTVDSTVKGDCRTALRTPAHDLKVLDQLSAVLPQVMRAQGTKTRKDDQVALRRLNRIDVNGVRSSAKQYAQFTSGCAAA